MGYQRIRSFIFLLIITAYAAGIIPEKATAQEAQNEVYLLFEFMEVEDTQGADYTEAEQFFKKIHQERVKSGEILGWDLWSLQPGGEEQGFQYLTVTVFDDPVNMMGDHDWNTHAQKAYPDMGEDELNSKFQMVSESRDLAVRLFLEQIATTEGDFEMKPGMVASIDLMKVKYPNYESYERGEREIFMPLHQELVKDGHKGNWELLRIISPTGTDTYASHITVNMYESWNQAFSSEGLGMESSMTQEMAIENFLELRKMKWVYWATLREMVR